MYTLREIKNNDGLISNTEIGNSYLEIEKKVDFNGSINQPFLDAYKCVFGKDYVPNNGDDDIRMIIEYTSPADGKIWHKVIKDYNSYYIMSDSGKTFEAIIANNKNGFNLTASAGCLKGVIRNDPATISADRINCT